MFVVVRVYIGDLGNNGDPDELRRMFSRYGSVQDVWVAHKPPGFAFVFYKTVREAREAVKGADGRMVCGVRVRVRMGTEVIQSEAHHRGRSFERDYDSPPRERSRRGNSYQSRSYQQEHMPHHSERSGRNYEERSSPPSRSSWSSKGSRRGISSAHPSSVGHASKTSHAEELYSSPHRRYGGHKRSYETSPRYSPSERYGREGVRITSSRHRHVSPDHFTRFSPSVELVYHSSKRVNKFDHHREAQHHEAQHHDYKEKSQRIRGGYKDRVHPKMSSHHRSRSPHSFSPPPVVRQQHDRRHGNKDGWSYSTYSPPPPPPSRRSHYDDNQDHRGYRDQITHDEQFEAHSFNNGRGDRGSRKDYSYDRRTESSRYDRNNKHSYKSTEREVKYRGHQRFPSSERYSEQAEYHEQSFPLRQERVEYTMEDRSDRGSSLEGVEIDDDFSDVIIEHDPNDLRRKLRSEGDGKREVREASTPERG